MMSAADALEASAECRGIEIGKRRGIEIGKRRGIEIGERRGKQRGKIEVLLQFGKTDSEIVQYLMTDTEDPVTEAAIIILLQHSY